MRPRLLQKREADAKRNEDLARHVAEGAKLAKRVDTLRETQAQEEANLTKFRTETLARIGEEIREKSSERDILNTEVRTLRKEIETGLTPLREKEDYLKIREEALETARVILDERWKTTRAEELKLREKRRALDERERIVGITETEANELLEKADARTLVTEQQKKILADERSEFKRTVEAREADLTYREANIAERETVLAQGQAKLRDDIEIVNNQKRQLHDREKTLERNIKRYGT